MSVCFCNCCTAISIAHIILVYSNFALHQSQSMAMVQALKNFNLYENFAYHISLLRQFVSIHTRDKVADSDDDSVKGISSVHGSNVWNSLKKKRGLGGSGHGGDPDSSVKSNSSFKGMKRISTATGALSSMGR